ncbi:MAG TPA: hypothetical protein PK052_12415, partial [Anaerohalosphaeraceae bacterium]|nr:hypothetical protein [Anaerohalosphaeraceae bacterium]
MFWRPFRCGNPQAEMCAAGWFLFARCGSFLYNASNRYEPDGKQFSKKEMNYGCPAICPTEGYRGLEQSPRDGTP